MRNNDGAGRVVVLLGPPGVGKGTQGVRLARESEWDHLSTGDLLRTALERGTALGKEARSYMEAGELVPDEVIVGLVGETLNAGRLVPVTLPAVEVPPPTPHGPMVEVARRGVVFDGFPRTVAQAKALDHTLEKAGRAVDRVCLLEAPEEVIVKRISGRRSSPGGRVYNVHFDPPEREGFCDDTGEPLIHRADDRPETVRRRLAVYRRDTVPLVGLYEERGVLRRVDGQGSLDEVYAALRAAAA